MFLVMLLLLVPLSSSSQHRQRYFMCDLIELNHFADIDKQEVLYTQVILWRDVPKRPPKVVYWYMVYRVGDESTDYWKYPRQLSHHVTQARFFYNGKQVTARAPNFKETLTLKDPEILNKDIYPVKTRIELDEFCRSEAASRDIRQQVFANDP